MNYEKHTNLPNGRVYPADYTTLNNEQYNLRGIKNNTHAANRT
jgi:hypothetical protein